MAVHQEVAFETAIEHDLIEAGWAKGSPTDYNRELGLDTERLVEFLTATQPDECARLEQIYGSSVTEKVVTRIAGEIDSRGTLDVLRNGVKDHGVALRLAFFEPPTAVNALLVERFAANVLSVTRQLAYEPKSGKELDLVLFVNGLPTATVELKNPLSGQNVEHAKHQYRRDRDPKQVIFAKRALVHFAVDPHLVFLTTKLAGSATRFLPFNLGTAGAGNDGGKGNPPNPHGYETDYLWRQVWAKAAWLDLLQRFIHVEGAKGKQTVIFPRFHQAHAVRSIAADVSGAGAGRNYLVQHSAGSGKSNTIAWLAHRLSKQHTPAEASALQGDAAQLGPGRKIFDKVIVITDRRVLDKQLQDTIFQFEHVAGVVQKIDEDSQQLADALDRADRAGHHHDDAEVPVRRLEDRRRSPIGATPSSSTRRIPRRRARGRRSSSRCSRSAATPSRRSSTPSRRMPRLKSPARHPTPCSPPRSRAGATRTSRSSRSRPHRSRRRSTSSERRGSTPTARR